MIDGMPLTGPSIFTKRTLLYPSINLPFADAFCHPFLVSSGDRLLQSLPKKRRGCAHRLLRLWRRRCFVGARGDTEKGLAAAWVLNGVNGVLYGVQ